MNPQKHGAPILELFRAMEEALAARDRAQDLRLRAGGDTSETEALVEAASQSFWRVRTLFRELSERTDPARPLVDPRLN